MLKNNKVTHDDMATLPEIWAVDFDGTIVEDRYPEIGEPDMMLIGNLIEARNAGIKLVLWTCRDNHNEHKLLNKAVEFCKSVGLEFDAVNTNIKEVKSMFDNDTRKVYANMYIDDKAALYKAGFNWH